MTARITSGLGRLMLCSAICALALGAGSIPAYAQGAITQPQTQTQAPSDQKLSQGQLDQLVAPIALYPDALLTQVLMASTYPLEVVEAARWSQENPTVTGTALQTAMEGQSWDPSVKSLTAVPQTLQLMNAKLEWTQQLGDAFLAQQQDVMDAVQKLRAEAQAAGNLQSNAQQRVFVQPTPSGVVSPSMQQAIVIEPAEPDLYYVPVYDPAVAYGNWDYPAYPPFYWSPPGFVAANVVSFAAGVAVGAAIWGGCDWWGHHVTINVNRFNVYNHTDITSNVWVHNPAHRGAIPYRSADVAARFGRAASFTTAQDALHDRSDTGRSDLPHGIGDAARIDAPRPSEHPAMPPRNPERPVAGPREQWMRSRAESFRPAPREMDRDVGLARRFGGGRERL